MSAPSQPCAKCGCTEVMPAMVVDRGDLNVEWDLRLRVDAKPDAFIFQGAWRSPLRAMVCSSCGFTEFFVEDPAPLYQAFLASKSRG